MMIKRQILSTFLNKVKEEKIKMDKTVVKYSRTVTADHQVYMLNRKNKRQIDKDQKNNT